jgi:hypothetical protein
MLIALSFAGALTGCGGSATMQPTTLVLTSSGTKVASGSSVTFEATVQTTNKVTGTVTFYDGSNAIGSGVTPTSGIAVLTTSSLSVGTHTITAKFSGDSENSPSTSSDSIEQTITGSFTVTINAVSGTLNQSFSIPATLQ